MTDLEQIIICWNNDAIKFNGTYVLMDKQTVEDYIKQAEEYKIPISHGICPGCMKKAIDDLDYQFLNMSKDYFGV